MNPLPRLSPTAHATTRPIVHIGYHKTATTWFQSRVWPSLSSHDYISRREVQDAFLMPPGLHFDPWTARRALQLEGRDRPVVLSEENLSGYIHNAGLHGLVGPEMARRIRETLPDAQIVIFIRNQVDAVRSSYCQYVSGGGTHGLRRYLDTFGRRYGALRSPFKAPAFALEHFEFDRLIAHYDALFGRRNVHVYPYELMRDRAAMLATMEKDLGIAFPAGLCEKRAANRSMSAAGSFLLRGANLFTCQSVVNKRCLIDLPGGQVLRHVAKGVLSLLPGKPLRMDARLRAEIEDHYRASNSRLARLRGLPLAELGYPLAEPSRETAYVSTSNASIVHSSWPAPSTHSCIQACSHIASM